MQNVNVNKLKGKIVEKGLNIEQLAEKIGIDRATMYRKLRNDCENLLINEANAIVAALGLTAEEAMSIFFAQYVA